MDVLPIMERFGFPVALVIYFLWSAHKVAANINEIQEQRIKREQEFATTYGSLVKKITQVMEKTNTVVERVGAELNLKASKEETKVIEAFEPSMIDTPVDMQAVDAKAVDKKAQRQR